MEQAQPFDDVGMKEKHWEAISSQDGTKNFNERINSLTKDIEQKLKEEKPC